MSSLFALLSQQNTNLQTRNGLIVLGLQNDFIAPDGKLPVRDTSFLDRLTTLVSDFREHGDVIWIRSLFEDTRPVNGLSSVGDTVIVGGHAGQDADLPASSKKTKKKKKKNKAPSNSSTTLSSSKPETGDEDDEELFLTRTANKEPCCVRGSPGAEYADRVKPLIQPRDLQLTKTHYSAFGGTSLLLSLRSRLITDLFVCGCITNLSVYATAMDAARHGIRIILVENCLGYRRRERHEVAVRQLEGFISAETMTSEKVMEELRGLNMDEAAYSEGASDGEVPNCAEPDRIEVGSDDDSDEEVSLPIVRPFAQLLDREVERSSSKYSHSIAARRRLSSSQHAQSSSSQPVHRGRSRRSVHGQERPEQRNAVESNINNWKASSHSKLDFRESAPTRNPATTEAESCDTTQISITTPTHPGPAASCSAAALSSCTAREYQVMVQPLFGKHKASESLGSRILHDLLPDEEAKTIFDELNSELNWQTMHHQTGAVPRLVCCQATVDEQGNVPVYRHPSDQTLPTTSWTAAVNRVRKAAEKAVGHTLNHALVQLYRNGNDYISEHSDKTLDIAPESYIVNVSFGAQRTMRLRTKRGAATAKQADESPARTTYRVPLPHNSMLMMSLPTNAEYLHAINWDRRPGVELSEAEKAFNGQRISLTFRNIGTFLDRDSTRIWGLGAIGKTWDEARSVVNGDKMESQKLIDAFGRENAASSVDYEEIYGEGSDVLHLK